MSDYQLPEVWEAPSQMGGAWGGLNQPTAGVRFEQSLSKGDQPFQLYTLPTPNGIKVTIMLEELKELGVDAGYDAYRIKIGDGDQFGSDFVAINPNSKIPAMLDQSGDQAIRVFESANILLYLAEKFGQLIPADPAKRTEVLNWLFWQTGAAPFLGGALVISSTMRRRKSSMPSTVLPWKPNANWIYWTRNWPLNLISQGMTIPLQISPSGLGMAVSPKTRSGTEQEFS